jgi:hypothetical protein
MEERERWRFGRSMSGRHLPLEARRRFAWVFTVPELAGILERDADVELSCGAEGDEVHVEWRGVRYRLWDRIDIVFLSKAMEAAPYFAGEAEFERLGSCIYVNFGIAASRLGCSCLEMAKFDAVHRVVCFDAVPECRERSRYNIALNAELTGKIEVIQPCSDSGADAVRAPFWPESVWLSGCEEKRDSRYLDPFKKGQFPFSNAERDFVVPAWGKFREAQEGDAYILAETTVRDLDAASRLFESWAEDDSVRGILAYNDLNQSVEPVRRLTELLTGKGFTLRFSSELLVAYRLGGLER